MVEPSSDSRYVVSSRFPALARNGTILFLMGRDAVVGVAKGLSWTPQWRDKDCSVSPKGGGGRGTDGHDFIQCSLSSPGISINYVEGG